MKRNRTEYNKKYSEDNKERIAARKKAYYQANKKSLAAKKKAYYETKKDGLYTIYLLPKENYVGMTSNLHQRLEHHKGAHNRDVTGVEILGKYKTKKMARYVEASYHDDGYDGKNTGEFKPQTNIAGVDFTESLNNLNNLL